MEEFGWETMAPARGSSEQKAPVIGRRDWVGEPRGALARAIEGGDLQVRVRHKVRVELPGKKSFRLHIRA